MKNEFSILKNYLLYFSTLFLVCFIGISNVFGATITDYGTKYYYYTVNDNSSTDVTSYRYGNDNFVTLFAPTAPTYDNSEGFNGFYNSIDYDIVQGNIYTLSMTLTFNGLQESEFSLSTLNERLLNLNFARGEEIEITAISGTYRRYNNTSPGLPSGLYDYAVRLVYTFVATSTTDRFWIGSYTGDDRTLCINDHLYTVTALISALTIEENNSSTIINQNDTIINQNNQIIEENRQNTQDIIDNQNQNSQEQIQSQMVCLNKSIKNGEGFGYQQGYLSSDGSIYNASNYLFTSDYISIKQNKSYTITLNYSASSPSYCLYDQDKVLISCSRYNNNSSLTFNSNNSYFIRYSYRTGTGDETILKGLICQNGNQALTDSLTDTTPVDMSGLGNTVGWLPAGPIDSIINLPLNFFNSMLSSLSGTCQALNITIPFINSTISIPCLSTIFGQIEGLTIFWNWVGRIASIYILYRYLISLWDYYDRLTTMQVNFRDDFGGGV